MIGLLVQLILVGVALYLVNAVIPMPPWLKTVINVVAAVIVCLMLLDFAGLYAAVSRRCP